MSECSVRVGSRAPVRSSSPASSDISKSSSQLSPLSRHRGARDEMPDQTDRSSPSSPASTLGISPVGGSVQCCSSGAESPPTFNPSAGRERSGAGADGGGGGEAAAGDGDSGGCSV